MTVLHNVLLILLDTVRHCLWNWFNLTCKLINSFECCHKIPYIKQNHTPVFGDENYCGDTVRITFFCICTYIAAAREQVDKKQSIQVGITSMWEWGKRNVKSRRILPQGKMEKTLWFSTVSINDKVITTQKSFCKPCSSFFSLPEVAQQYSKLCELSQIGGSHSSPFIQSVKVLYFIY